LLEHKRYITALFSASIYKKNIPTDLIVKMLLETSMYDFIEPIQKYFDAYKIADLFKVLDERGYNNKDIFIQLEWKYISILSDKLWKRPPKYLHKEMINNPNFYVEVINAIYKPKDDVEMEKQETKGMDEKMIKNRWEGAYDLLKSLDKLPGETEKGNVNFDVLKVWIDTVQELCKAKKRVFAGDYHIGELLASPDHSNDVWPPEAVCKVIEYYRNKDIEEGFYIFERNRRGTTTRGVFEGGKQEKDEAKKYYNFAKNIDPKYQRTIKLLKNIAKSYEYDADREDREAEQDKMDY
jgi:hypothetical protein